MILKAGGWGALYTVQCSCLLLTSFLIFSFLISPSFSLLLLSPPTPKHQCLISVAVTC